MPVQLKWYAGMCPRSVSGSIAGTVNIRTDRANYGTAQSLSTELGRNDFSHAQYSYNYGNDYSVFRIGIDKYQWLSAQFSF